MRKFKKIFIIYFLLILLINNIICFGTEENNLSQEENVIESESEVQEENIDTNNVINEVEVDEYGLKIYSEAACMLESSTGKVLYDKNKDQRMYPASTTKILTAILAIENCDLEEDVEISQNAIDSLKKGYTKSNMQAR